MDTRTYDNALDVLARFKTAEFDDMVFVGPLSVLGNLTKVGVEPLRAIMEPVDKNYMGHVDFTDTKTQNRQRFAGYTRVHGFDIRETKLIESLCC